MHVDKNRINSGFSLKSIILMSSCNCSTGTLLPLCDSYSDGSCLPDTQQGQNHAVRIKNSHSTESPGYEKMLYIHIVSTSDNRNCSLIISHLLSSTLIKCRNTIFQINLMAVINRHCYLFADLLSLILLPVHPNNWEIKRKLSVT